MPKVLAGSDLKVIAIVTMLIDHMGAILFPDVIILRMIGRLAFPIFAFLLVEGFFHTSDRKKYMTRLLMYALVSEVVFDLAFFGTFFEMGHQNIFFTLFLGLCAMMIFDQYRIKNPIAGWGFLIGIGFLATFFFVDYGMIGIATIFLYYYYHESPKRAIYSVGAMFAIMAALSINNASAGGELVLRAGIQGLAALAIPLLLMYSGERGLRFKYVFYLFYPVHLLILFGIDKLFFS